MYHALLPEQATKSLKAEYRVRFLIVLLFFVSLAIVVGAICLFPSYLISSLNEKASAASAGAAAKSQAHVDPSVSAGLSSAASLVSLVSSFDSPPLSAIVLRIASLRPKGVVLSSISVDYEGGASSTVDLEGTADTREDLVGWERILEGDQDFSGVTVPISDLAPSSDLQFSLQMSAVAAPNQ